MNCNKVTAVPITRIGPNFRGPAEDFLVREEEWGIMVNGEGLAILNCLPFHLEQLAVGHLFSLGRLRRADEIIKVDIDKEAKKIDVKLNQPNSPGRPLDEGDISLSASDIHRLQREFNERSELFRKTGAVHSVALADRDGLLIFIEDVARHNALDKVIGEMVLREMPASNKALIFSGRPALDMLRKVCATDVRLLIAPGAPTAAAVRLARDKGITLLGFVREDNINIYTHDRRIY